MNDSLFVTKILSIKIPFILLKTKQGSVGWLLSDFSSQKGLELFQRLLLLSIFERNLFSTFSLICLHFSRKTHEKYIFQSSYSHFSSHPQTTKENKQNALLFRFNGTKLKCDFYLHLILHKILFKGLISRWQQPSFLLPFLEIKCHWYLNKPLGCITFSWLNYFFQTEKCDFLPQNFGKVASAM